MAKRNSKTPNKIGKPTVMTPPTLDKLRQAFLIGASDREACLYADISMQTLYNYQKKHPEYVEQKAMWKETPVLKARKTLADNLDKPEHAKWYLERKRKYEFAERKELGGEDGGPVKILLDIVKDDQKIQRVDELPTETVESLPDSVDPTV